MVPVEISPAIPLVAKGDEDIYDRFLKGKLIYKPDPRSDEGKVELWIADLKDPLNGTFDLSRCGDAEQYLSISTGYRKGKKLENEGKAEIWLVPRFLVKKELRTTASHFKPIMSNWKQNQAPVGLFWTWGGYDNVDCNYLTTESTDSLSKIDLYKNWNKSREIGNIEWVNIFPNLSRACRLLTHFHVSFLNTPLQVVESEGQIKKKQCIEKKREEKGEMVPAEISPTIPLVAKGDEDIYDRFLKGKLIYKPKMDSDEGKVELRIADLKDPLNGTFDLSHYGETGKYLSISTGYRKGKKPENEYKVEIWLVPRFLIEKELSTTASHFKPIMDNWSGADAPVGIFWTGGGWDNMSWYDYLTNESMEGLSEIDLYDNWKKRQVRGRMRNGVGVGSVSFGWMFHVSFMG